MPCDLAVLTGDVSSRQPDLRLRRLGDSIAREYLEFGVHAEQSQISNRVRQGGLTHEIVGGNAVKRREEPG